ncbi:MAG: trypsin-like peptidase domain-containing protein [Acidimicrobiia bacterium]|nr:trypsin-like peptidase domain-containing protein [Acidimicrobiia bacterium]MDH5289308.1 trypsin-like peptidase domain-containing protein [Acidimicrobiia bacterium]
MTTQPGGLTTDPDATSGPTAEWAIPPTPTTPYVPPVITPPPAAPPVAASGRGGRVPRRLLAAVAALAIAGGTVGGAVAGRHEADIAAPTTTAASGTTASSTLQGTTGASTPAVAGARADVSGLIDGALPSVVSITVTMPQGQGAGTGFVVSTDGRIATNAHVVADARSIQVAFHNGTTAPATVVGVDRTDDLAVIKVDRTGLTPLTLGTSADLKMGEPVVAIGNALDLTGGPTATEGIVSALDRHITTNEGGSLSHLIQIDAAINPGNSGGPLLTLDGKVVGINSAASVSAQNIGFAIAIDTARPIVEQLEAGKTVTTGYLGVSTAAVDESVAARFGLKVDHGVLVADVAANSSASAAGLQPGDVIVSLDGTATDDPQALADAIHTAGPGHQVHLQVNRAGQTLAIDATLSSHTA